MSRDIEDFDELAMFDDDPWLGDTRRVNKALATTWVTYKAVNGAGQMLGRFIQGTFRMGFRLARWYLR